MNIQRIFLCSATILFHMCSALAGILNGTVSDKSLNEPLCGATVQILQSKQTTATDLNGQFQFPNLQPGTYSILVKYVGYKPQSVEKIVVDGQEPAHVDINLITDQENLGEVVVTTKAFKNTEMAMLSAMRQSSVVQSGVSSQQIKQTQDKDASEVIRRIPGISIIDDKFVMVRGLSQRYNNVWINGSSVPSTEADSRAFSFDIIPSSQLDNLLIIKSPAPEYPADFTGGFVFINTKDVPERNAFSMGLGVNYNNQSHLQGFLYNQGSNTDWLGFDNGLRQLNGGIRATLKPIGENGIDLMGNGFHNDWTVKKKKPLADFSFNTSINRYWRLDERTLALMGTLNYSNTFKTLHNMSNNLFGSYDRSNDRSNYLRKSVDNQYNNNVRLGAMLNLTLVLNPNNRLEWKHLFNQLGKSRYTSRVGINAQNDNEHSAEYYYSSRSIYNTQFTGFHNTAAGEFKWNAGYAFANRNMPDRRLYLLNDKLEDGIIALSSSNDISREFTSLNEHIVSGGSNWQKEFNWGKYTPTLKAGMFGEYRTRSYFTRYFIYNWNNLNNTLPSDFRMLDLPTQLLTDANYGEDKLFLLEEVKWSNNYDGNNTLGAGYFAANLPLGDFDIYAGVRYEYNRMELTTNTRDFEKSPSSKVYNNHDFFPSVNATWRFIKDHQLRLAYGKSINRPEFRELSPSVFYDFDLASDVQGNTELKSCYVQNVDLRWEWYPHAGEQISVALFYKHFKNPIEWTYTVAGGTDLVYSYHNAKSARNYGLELDIHKKLDFMGLPFLSLNFNASFIQSRVNFEPGSREKTRPMQGQSPYLINTGLFYSNKAGTLNMGLLYNRIGKRIIGVGRSVGLAGSDDSANIPNSYEMPRDVFDLTASYRVGQHLELKATVRDLLDEKITFKQFTNAIHPDGSSSEVDEITKQYRPGRNISLSIQYNF